MAKKTPPGPEAPLTRTPLTALRRRPNRGSHDRATVHDIIDEALYCHVAVTIDGQPVALPTAHVRIGACLYVHGARANRAFGVLATGAAACVTVTLLDGLVFARTWFHHSVNYRCAVLYGEGDEVVDAAEKRAVLAALIDKAAPGRTREARPPTPEELASTLVVRFPIDQASAKLRTGPPLDDAEQWKDDCWAGVLPLALTPRPPKDDPNLHPGLTLSSTVANAARALAGRPSGGAPYERTRGPHTVTTDAARIDFAFVHAFLANESYWAQGLAAHEHQTAMAHSLCFGLYEGATQLGFARVLTDYGRIAYLADVFVTRDARRAGLGTWLVACVLEHPDLVTVPRWLLATADAHRLYERQGFVRAEAGRYMIRTRLQGGASPAGATR
jgi:nitroimidazol reductase NimA-like FMN-containing flavoprotein (pyridoxamine 5'-phosphate oxidase superfamily)/GNAT superfamily N-acetyltransferase